MSPTADPASTASNEPKKKYLPPEIIEPIVDFVALCPYTKILATNDSGKWGPCYCSDLRKLWLPLLTVSKTWSGVVIAKIWAHLHRKELKRVHEKVNAEFSELIAKHSWACRYLYFTPHSSDADRELLSDLFGGTILSPKPQSSLEASTCWSGLRRLDISVDQSNADGLARALSAADFLKNIYFSMEDLGPESVANICRNMPACLQELDLRSRGKSEVEGRHLETTLQRCGNSIEKLRVSIHYAPSIVAEKWCFPLDRVPIALPRLRELQISCTPCGCWAHLFEAPALDMLEISMRDEDNWHHGADSVGVLLARSRNLNELYIPNWQNDEQVLGYPSVQANWPPNLERLYMSPYSFESKPGLWQTLVKLSPNLRYFAPPDEPDSIFTNQGLSLLGSLQKLEVLSMSCVRQDTADIELLAKHIRNFPSLRRIGLPIDDDDLEEHVDLLEAARPGISVEIS